MEVEKEEGFMNSCVLSECVNSNKYTKCLIINVTEGKIYRIW